MPFGRKILSPSSGVGTALTFDGRPEWKPIGATFDWTTVAAVASDTFVPGDQLTVPNGQKYLRYGQLMCQITATGLFGPYDSAAADGRQLLVNGNCGFINQTILQNGLLGFTVANTDNAGLIVGGYVWSVRLIQSGVAVASLAAGPTLATLLAAMPRLVLAQ